MNYSFNSTFFLVILIISTFAYTSCGTEPDNDHTINPNIQLLKNCCRIGEKLSGNIIFGHFYNDSSLFYLGDFFGYLVLDKKTQILEDSIFVKTYDVTGERATYMSRVGTFSNFLVTLSNFGDVSSGRLYEYDFDFDRFILIKDSATNVSSAVYLRDDDLKLFYYSYGNDQELQAGYYLYNKETDTDSLVLAHRSEIGPKEMLNGFDLSPDGSKLLYPNIRASFTNPDAPQTPQIIEYNLHTQLADTFATEFDLSFVRVGLWLRYSPSGNQILYANFPFGSLGVTTNDDSEVGIIELPSRKKRILNLNTNPDGEQRSVQIAPTWSPDGKNIIYGSGSLFYPSGAKGTYSLYLLKNIDDPRNYLN